MPGPLPAEWLCSMHPDPACRVCEAPTEESGPGRAQAELQAAAVVAEAERVHLHPSSSSSTGYKGVFKHASGRFKAEYKVGGRMVYIGAFGTADPVEAAVAYAQAVGEYHSLLLNLLRQWRQRQRVCACICRAAAAPATRACASTAPLAASGRSARWAEG